MGSSSSVARKRGIAVENSQIIIVNPMESSPPEIERPRNNTSSNIVRNIESIPGQNNEMSLTEKTKLIYKALFGNRAINYIPTIMGYTEDSTKTWWFPEDFCQSRLGDRVIGSNACTLIDVLMMHRIEFHKITIKGELTEPLSPQLVSALAESIIDGNEVYEHLQAIGKIQHPYLSLPEALSFYKLVKDELHLEEKKIRSLEPNITDVVELNNFVEIHSSLNKLFDVCDKGIMDWEVRNKESLDAKKCLYMVLIAGDRSVLLVYQRHRRQVTLIDSHGHQNRGAVVAQTNILNLRNLCNWYANMCKRYFHTAVIDSFEVSFLHYQ